MRKRAKERARERSVRVWKRKGAREKDVSIEEREFVTLDDGIIYFLTHAQYIRQWSIFLLLSLYIYSWRAHVASRGERVRWFLYARASVSMSLKRIRRERRRRNGGGGGGRGRGRRSVPFPTTFPSLQNALPGRESVISCVVERKWKWEWEWEKRGSLEVPANPRDFIDSFIVIGYVTLLYIPRADLNYRY